MNSRRPTFLVLFLVISFLATLPAAPGFAKARGGISTAGMGVGLVVNPASFDFTLGGEYRYDPRLSLGLDLHILPRSSNVIFLFLPQARYYITITGQPKLAPFIGAGLGPAFDTNGSGALDILLPSFGLDFEIARDLTLGSDLGLHIVTDFESAKGDFHLLLARLKYKF